MNDIQLIPITLPQLAALRPGSTSSAKSISARQAEEEVLDINTSVEQSLAPVDGGLAAWRLLFAAFVFETLLWGFPLSFGVFQDYYSKTTEFARNRYIPVVGTVASGLGYLGIAYGTGFLIFYYPILSMVDEYWIAKRGMAYGILCAASGFSGAFMPFILQSLLHMYGWRITLRAVAVALTIATGPLIPLLEGRLPESRATIRRKINWKFLESSTFWIYSTANLLQGFGYFFPALYLPSFASSLGLGANSGAILLAIMSISQVAGQFTFGYLSDRKVPVNILALLSTTMAAIACLAIWRNASSLPILVVFAIFYGFFGAGFTATWARITSAITEDIVTAPMVFGLLNFGKGVGNVLAGPIGGILVSDSAGIQDGGNYRLVILFTGVCMVASACVICSRYCKIGFDRVRGGA
ncbi:major facilitator superfamily transporter [Aureobasidium pullulans]|nr:major facilitator superfamily transporter [Aureobasidium pullulans]